MSSTKYCSEEKIWRGSSKPAWLFNEKANLGRILLSILNRNPQKVAQISDNNGIRMTNREIASDAEKIAGGLKQRGCRTGDVVGFVARNGHNITPTLIACFLLEAPTNAMDISQNEDQIFDIFKITKPKFIFCDHDKFNFVQRIIERLRNNATIIIYGGKVPDQVHIEELMKEGDYDDIRKEIYLESCRDMVCRYQMIVCSSGTTGPPKAVGVPYQTMLDPQWDSKMNANPTDILFNASTIFWSVSYIVLLRSILCDFTRIISTETFNPELYLHILHKYKVTHIQIAAGNINQLLESEKFTKSSFDSLKQIWTGGNVVTEELVGKLMHHMDGKEFQIAYGMSEIGCIASYVYDSHRSVCVGNLLPGHEGIVIDEDERRLGPGEIGELCYRTPYHMIEYINNPEATKNCFDSEGFLHSGDIGFYNEEGFLHIVGRCKDIIRYFMLHVSGAEIERITKTHPGVAEVVAIGIRDAKAYQLPAVVVVRRQGFVVTTEEIMDLVARNLPDNHKLRGGVYFIDKIPTTFSGKLKRFEAEKYAEEMYRNSNGAK